VPVIKRCAWKSSQYYIIISMSTSFMRMSQKLVFHQSKCICAIKRILSTTAMYVSSSSFIYLRFPCYCNACLNSSTLHVGLKTFYSIQYNTQFISQFKSSFDKLRNTNDIGLEWSQPGRKIAIKLMHKNNLNFKLYRSKKSHVTNLVHP